jgi:hypothetical protein
MTGELELVSWEYDGEKVMVRGHFKAVPAVAGWTAVYIVDDDGNLLNTEPVCTVCERYHSWFIEWLQEQKCPEMFPPVRQGK